MSHSSSSSKSAPAVNVTPATKKRIAEVEMSAPEPRKSKFDLVTESMEPLALPKLEVKVTRLICDSDTDVVGLIVEVECSDLVKILCGNAYYSWTGDVLACHQKYSSKTIIAMDPETQNVLSYDTKMVCSFLKATSFTKPGSVPPRQSLLASGNFNCNKLSSTIKNDKPFLMSHMTTQDKERKGTIEILNRDLLHFLTNLHGKHFMDKNIIDVTVTNFEPEIDELKFWGYLSREMSTSRTDETTLCDHVDTDTSSGIVSEQCYSYSTGTRVLTAIERRQRNKESKRACSLTEEARERKNAKKRVANMSESSIQSQRERMQIANMSESSIQSQRDRHRIANMSESSIVTQRNRDLKANMSESSIQSQRDNHRIRHLTPKQIQSRNERHVESYHRSTTSNASRNTGISADRSVTRAYYGNLDFDEDDELERDNHNIEDLDDDNEMPNNKSNFLKEKTDIQNFIRHLDISVELTICIVCSEEHSEIEMTKKHYDINDSIFNVLKPTPTAMPILAFDHNLINCANIPVKICRKCLRLLKQQKIPPRSVRNFKLLTDEKFMRFFRGLNRIEARLISKVIPVTTINIQKVYGDSNNIQHAKTKNNTISLRAATSKVIEKMLPRSMTDIGLLNFRSRSRNLMHANVNNKYENLIVNPVSVLQALGVLTGVAQGMSSPLNRHYAQQDQLQENCEQLVQELKQTNGTPPTIDITEDDNDDELGNSKQLLKRRITYLFGGTKYKVKTPVIYNSRFTAYVHNSSCAFYIAICAACHWEFGGCNIIKTFKDYVKICQTKNLVSIYTNQTNQQIPFEHLSTSTQHECLVNAIGFALNADNPDVSMSPRSAYPPIMRCSIKLSPSCVYTMDSLLKIIETKLLTSYHDVRSSNDVKQIIIQTHDNNFICYVRESNSSHSWFTFDPVNSTPSSMQTSTESCDIIFPNYLYHCWGLTAPLLNDTTHNHNQMMECVRQSMRRHIAEVFITHSTIMSSSGVENNDSVDTTDDNANNYTGDTDFCNDEDEEDNNGFVDKNDEIIENLERFVDINSWNMNTLRDIIVELDIGDGDKSVSGVLEVDTGENGLPVVFNYTNRPFTDKETGKNPFDTVGYTFPHLFPDGNGGFNDIREVKVAMTDWVAHLLHFCELVKDEATNTYVRVRRFQTSLDFCFWLENKMQMQQACGVAFVAGDRAKKRGVQDPLSASAVNSANLLSAIRAAKLMTEEQFTKAISARASDLSLTDKILRQLEPYSANYLNSHMQTKFVRRCAYAALMDPNSIEGADPSIFFTVNQDDINHIDIHKMIHAQKYQNIKSEDIRIPPESQEQFEKQQAVDVSNNPFMSVKYFHARKAGIINYLVDGERKPFGGAVVDSVIKTEFQRGGGLHMHCLLWIARHEQFAHMQPEELLRSEEGIQHITRLVDGMYDGDIPGGLDVKDLLQGNESVFLDATVVVPKEICKLALQKVRQRCRPIIPNDHNQHQCEEDARYVILAKNAHKCCATCFKKQNTCRFNFPRDRCHNTIVKVNAESTNKNLIKDMTILVPRNHCWINSHTKGYMASSIRSNHDIRYCNNPWGDTQYCLNYTTKEGTPDRDILNKRVHKSICRHSHDADLTTYFRSTILQLDGSRERSITEVINTLLRFKNSIFTRSTVKLNTHKPDQRKTNIRKCSNIDHDLDDESKEPGNNNDESEESYELCETIVNQTLYNAYKCRPHSGTCPNIKQEWNEVCLIDFVAWYRPDNAMSSPKAKNHRIELLDGSMWVARNRRSIVLLYPYIKLNISNEASAYSVLVSFVPFRKEEDLISPEHSGSAVSELRTMMRNTTNIIPNHVVQRIRTCLDREELRSTIANSSSILNNETTANTVDDDYFDNIDDDEIIVDIDRNAQIMTEHDDLLSTMDVLPSMDLSNSGIYKTSDLRLLDKLEHSLSTLKEMFHAHKSSITSNNTIIPQDNNTTTQHQQQISISTIIQEDINKLSSSIKQSCIYQLAYYYFQNVAVTGPLTLCISGPAGTGKSTVLHSIIRLGRHMFPPDAGTGQHGTVIVIAWSGIAAFNCGGSTVSSIFIAKANVECIQRKLSGVKLVIIDEHSTMPLNSFGLIDQQLRCANKCEEPFGGAHVIIAGDMRQLRAVKAKAIYQDPNIQTTQENVTKAKQAFKERLRIGRDRYIDINKYVELTKQFRQQQSRELGSCLGRCRTNNETPEDLALLNSRYYSDSEEAVSLALNQENSLFLATTNARVTIINDAIYTQLKDTGNASVVCYALHRRVLTQRTSGALQQHIPEYGEEDDFDNNEETIHSQHTNMNTNSGLSQEERLACLVHTTSEQKLHSKLYLAINSRVMLIQNIDPLLGLVNGTTGTVVEFVYSSMKRIITDPINDYLASVHEPQLPIVLMRVDKEFWLAPDTNFNINPPLPDIAGDWERVIAINPVVSGENMKMNFASGATATIKRIQLPLIPASALTVHKSQGLNKNVVVFDASLDSMFERALAYVALSRCTSLNGLYIVGDNIVTKHFKQTYGEEDKIITSETNRLRKFQGNTLREGMRLWSINNNTVYNSLQSIIFPIDEPEFDM